MLTGGHPRNWNQLSQAVLARIADFTRQLQRTRQVGGAAPAAQSARPSTVETPQASNGVRLRSLAQNAARRNEEIAAPAQSEESANAFAKLMGKLREKLVQNPLVSAYPESESRKLLSACQDVIWAVEGEAESFGGSA
jgi:hypothetical protein